MIEQKKKCWREKVTAEITLAHVQAFAEEVGTNITVAEVATFLNQNGRAQGLWSHMMQAGEQFIKSNLKPEAAILPPERPIVAQNATIQ
jgi:hypothetical protein